MQDYETIISGVVPPKKRNSKAIKIIAAILFFAVIAAGTYFFASGMGDGFAKKTLAIATRSWHEILGISDDGPIVAEVDLSSQSPIGEYPSSSASIVENSSSSRDIPQDVFKKSIKKQSKAQNITSSSPRTAVDILENPIISADAPTSSSSSLTDITISHPIVIADNNAESSSASGGLGIASSGPSLGKPMACSFSNIAMSTSVPRVVLNEIAWMGSPMAPGETATRAANREWIELKNVTESQIDLSNWQVADSAGNIDATFGMGDALGSGEFMLLSRDGDAVQGVSSDKAYSGGLSNAGELLAVFDKDCGVSDILDASKGWPGGDNVTKQTLERKVDGVGWQTSLLPGGTPRVENSIGAPQNTSSSVASSTYPVEVTIAGDGGGTITSDPAGILCGTGGTSTCTARYSLGTSITLTASFQKNTMFVGWTGPCSGAGKCSFSVGGDVSVMAQFHSTPIMITAETSTTDDSSEIALPVDAAMVSSTELSPVVASSTIQPSSSMESQEIPGALDHLLIAEIQIAGASSSNDFVKLFNPTSAAIDLSGWKLHKKSSTGTDYSLRDFPKGTTIAPDTFFTWANALNGFAESIGADISSTETLSIDNSVALMDATGLTIDAVAWGSGSNQYSEGHPYSTDPAPNQVLLRKSVDGALVDTNNNASDFVLQ